MRYRIEATHPAIVDSVRKFGTHLHNNVRFTQAEGRVISEPVGPSVVSEQFEGRSGYVLCRDEPGFERVNDLAPGTTYLTSINGVALDAAGAPGDDLTAGFAPADALTPASIDGDQGALTEAPSEPQPAEPAAADGAAGAAAAAEAGGAGDTGAAPAAGGADDDGGQVPAAGVAGDAVPAADAPATDDPYAGLTKAQLMARLDQAGVSYNRRANRDELAALLAKGE